MNSFTKRSRRQRCSMLVASFAVIVPLTIGTAGPALADQVAQGQLADDPQVVGETDPTTEGADAETPADDAETPADDAETPADDAETTPEEVAEIAPLPAPTAPAPDQSPSAPAGPGVPSPASETPTPRADTWITMNGNGKGTYSPGQASNINLLQLKVASGASVGANGGTLRIEIAGPATTSSSTVPYAVSTGGTRNLTGCSVGGGTTMSCSNGNPFEMTAGSSTNVNNIRVPVVVDTDALPGDVFTVTTTFELHGTGLVNTNPVNSTVYTGTIPLTPASITSSGTVGATPVIAGRGVPGGTVDVSVAGRTPIVADVESDGSWAAPVMEPLPEGAASLEVVQHRNGLTAAAVTGSVMVDATAPGAPVVDAPAVWENGTGTLRGTAEPGSTVVVRDADGTEIGSAIADPDTGEWSIPVTQPLPEGANQLFVTASDEYGNESSASSVTVDVPDTTAPPVPVVEVPGTWADGTGTLAGTAEPGATIEIRDADGVLIGTADADETTGVWSFEVRTPLPEGSNALDITATDADGNVSSAATVTVEVPDGTAPIAPIVDVPGVWEDGTGTLGGVAEPGSTVVVRDADGKEIGSATADEETGEWTIVVTTPLPEGENTLTVTATDAAGNVSPGSDVQVDVPDTTAPDIPVVEAPGTWQDGTGTLSGVAEPGSTVVVRDAGGEEIGSATADEVTGEWEVVVTTPLPEGSNALDITATDADGNVSSAAAVTVEVPDTTAPDAPVVDVPEDTNWEDGTGNLSGTAEPGSTIEVRDEDGNVVGSGDVDPVTGRWTVELTTPLPEGSHELVVVAIDADGNESDASTITVTVPDTTAPAVPVIDGGSVGQGEPITGSAEAGSTIEIRDAAGLLIGSGTADEDGVWSIIPNRPLPVGANAITVTATDDAGNVSAIATATVTVTPAEETGGESGAGAGTGAGGATLIPAIGTEHAAAPEQAAATPIAPVQTGKRLAYTGSEGAGMLAAGAAALLALGAALRIGRRRRS